MKYTRRYYDKDEWEDVTYDDALFSLVGTLGASPAAVSMLKVGNHIPCRFAEIRVYDDNGWTAPEGKSFLFPAEYDILGRQPQEQ